MASDPAALEGGCLCGRNHYIIYLPTEVPSSLAPSVVFDQTFDSFVSHSSLLPTFLRVPLAWLHSSTYALYPSETHSSIRRVFTPRHAPNTKRHFCGFCGTPLTLWREDDGDSSAADWVCINMSSLESDSVAALEERGFLPSASEGDEASDEEEAAGGSAQEKDDNEPQTKKAKTEAGGQVVQRSQGSRRVAGQPWFEEMIEGSRLGRVRRRRGGETSADGTSTYEWEIVEFDGGDVEGDGSARASPSKRKLDEASEDDVQMRGG